MTAQVIAVLVSMMSFQAIRALWASLKKERVMVREGGSPLPTSSWVFLGIEVLSAPLFMWLYALLVVPVVAIFPTSIIWLILFSAIGYIVAMFLSRLISVITVTITKMVLIKKQQSAIKGNTEQEVAQAVKQNIFLD